jgi:hypothetical protein
VRYQYYNPNPVGRSVGDCSVRAVAKALDLDWEQAYAELASNGFAMGDMPSSDGVWGATLRQHGFYKSNIPDNCPDCYTLENFVTDNPFGIFVVKLGNDHVATIIDGTLYDAWDSRNELPIFCWYRG